MKWPLLLVVFLAATAFANEEPLFAISRVLPEPTDGTRQMKSGGSDEMLNVERKASLGLGDVEKVALAEGGGVRIDFTKEGEQKLNNLCGESKGKPIAVLVNGAVVFAPVPASTTMGKSVVIDGNFSKGEAEKFVAEFEKVRAEGVER